jgi:hypothetical protein
MNLLQLSTKTTDDEDLSEKRSEFTKVLFLPLKVFFLTMEQLFLGLGFKLALVLGLSRSRPMRNENRLKEQNTKKVACECLLVVVRRSVFETVKRALLQDKAEDRF